MKPRDNNSLRGVILLAHGSSEPGAAEELRELCLSLSNAKPEWHFEPAFLNHEPKIESAAEALISLGCEEVQVLPLLVFKGKHLQQDIPGIVETLRKKHPEISFETKSHLFQMNGFKDLILNELR